MQNHSKLFLYSLSLKNEHFDHLDELAGKTREEISMGLIVNATDVIGNAESWVGKIIASIREKGYQTQLIDLRKWVRQPGLADKLAGYDVLWICGGHTYYLRWILAESGADTILANLVRQGTVYAGWSAGEIVAGPTTRYFDLLGDDPKQAPSVIHEGIHLTEKVVIPHMDNPDFEKGAALAHEKLMAAGYQTIPLKDDQVLIRVYIN